MSNKEFRTISPGFNSVYKQNRLSLGLVVPLETYTHSPVPTMKGQLELILLAEKLGFSAVWLRDIPFNVPSFGDVGQMFDPFVYLGFLAAKTEKIALGVGSIILPLRHPAHIAKEAASVDALSNGRLILGVASGDRAEEYPALRISYPDRGDRFRDSFDYIKKVWQETPKFENYYGSLNGWLDMLPKPQTGEVPLLVTGASQQDRDWIAKNTDGWITYPRDPKVQGRIINDFRERVFAQGERDKPISQSLYIDLTDNPESKPEPIHLGFRSGSRHLLSHLKALEEVGVNHVALNLRLNQIDIEETLKRLADEILPHFQGGNDE